MVQSDLDFRTLVFLVALILTGVAGYYLWTMRPLSPSDKLLIRKEVALTLFEENGTGFWDKGYYFLGVNESDSLGIKGSDPSSELLDQLEHDYPVLPVSKAEIRKGEPPESGVFHRQTGERGVMYTIGEVKRTDRGQVSVEAIFYAYSLGAKGYRCIVIFSESSEVKSCEEKWIS